VQYGDGDTVTDCLPTMDRTVGSTVEPACSTDGWKN
jgi:hypothetical protein